MATKTVQPRRLVTYGQVRVLDEQNGLVESIISTGNVARDNAIIEVKGWLLENYLKNPIVLWAHDDFSLPIAKATEVRIDGKDLVSIAQFDMDDYFATFILSKIVRGYINATSVRWFPLEMETREVDGEEILVFLKQELLEYSYVALPADPGALIMTAEGAAANLSKIDLGSYQRFATRLRPPVTWRRPADDLLKLEMEEIDARCEDGSCDIGEGLTAVQYKGGGLWSAPRNEADEDDDGSDERPYENEHACRLLDPDDFCSGSFRRGEREDDGKTLYIVYGKLEEACDEDDPMVEQAYRYPKADWTEDEAKEHCDAHDGIAFEPAAVDDEEGEGSMGTDHDGKTEERDVEALNEIYKYLEGAGQLLMKVIDEYKEDDDMAEMVEALEAVYNYVDMAGKDLMKVIEEYDEEESAGLRDHLEALEAVYNYVDMAGKELMEITSDYENDDLSEAYEYLDMAGKELMKVIEEYSDEEGSGHEAPRDVEKLTEVYEYLDMVRKSLAESDGYLEMAGQYLMEAIEEYSDEEPVVEDEEGSADDGRSVRPLSREHSCSLRTADDFDPESFRRETRDHQGVELSAIVGRLAADDSAEADQSFRYDMADWKEKEASKHCSAAGGEFQRAKKASAADVVTKATSVVGLVSLLRDRLEKAGRLDGSLEEALKQLAGAHKPEAKSETRKEPTMTPELAERFTKALDRLEKGPDIKGILVTSLAKLTGRSEDDIRTTLGK